MQEMLNSVELNTDKYSRNFQEAVENAVDQMLKLKELRTRASEGLAVDHAINQFQEYLNIAIRELPRR